MGAWVAAHWYLASFVCDALDVTHVFERYTPLRVSEFSGGYARREHGTAPLSHPDFFTLFHNPTLCYALRDIALHQLTQVCAEVIVQFCFLRFGAEELQHIARRYQADGGKIIGAAIEWGVCSYAATGSLTKQSLRLKPLIR